MLSLFLPQLTLDSQVRHGQMHACPCMLPTASQPGTQAGASSARQVHAYMYARRALSQSHTPATHRRVCSRCCLPSAVAWPCAAPLQAIKLQYNAGSGGCFPMHFDSDEQLDGRRVTTIIYLNPRWVAGGTRL
jgi:hypothetical protein